MSKGVQLGFHKITTKPALLFDLKCLSLERNDKTSEAQQMKFLKPIAGYTLQDSMHNNTSGE
jgi:hypothetical protein